MSAFPCTTHALRHDWTIDDARALFEFPFNDLLFVGQTIHRQFFDPNKVQISNLLSIKTGGYPVDCGYCPQSAKFETGAKAEKLMDVDSVVAEAEQVFAGVATRFCMGAASIFIGRKSLPTPSPGRDRDAAQFSRLGLTGKYHSSSDFDDALE